MEGAGGSALAEDDHGTFQSNASEPEGDRASDDELDSPALSCCSTYSYNPADFPRACEIEEFMSPSFRWPDSPSTSFASRSPGYNIKRKTRADHPGGDASIFSRPRIKFAWWRQRKPPDDPDPLLMSAPAHLVRFSLQELQVATGGFSISNLLGEDSIGKVYKGRLSNGSLVAVKRCILTSGTKSSFEAEVMSSIAFPHPNLLQLVGFCVTRAKSFLVYPYMSNGNVLQRLIWCPPSEPSLDWATRVRIALGTARGLSYLHNHCDPKIVHGDVKAVNVFLNDDFEPRIGGFGMASLMDSRETHVTDVVDGIISHKAPECTSSVVSDATDVFGYGMMLLQLITGKMATDLTYLPSEDNVTILDYWLGWVKLQFDENKLELLMDPYLHYKCLDVQHLVKLALLCTQEYPLDRPKMSEVVMMLEGVARGNMLLEVVPVQSTAVTVEEMQIKSPGTEQWMSRHFLPEYLRKRVSLHEQNRWQEMRGVNEEQIPCNLPNDLRRHIKRHLSVALLKRVPMFEKMDGQLMGAMCGRLRPVLFTQNSIIIREGDPVHEMLFIMSGKLQSVATNGGRIGFSIADILEIGNICGDELLAWALDPYSSSSLPLSTRTINALTEFEAFALAADDLKYVASQFRRLPGKQMRYTFRYYSYQWRIWAACFIQKSWRQYSRKMVEEFQNAGENRKQATLSMAGGISRSLGATIYAS